MLKQDQAVNAPLILVLTFVKLFITTKMIARVQVKTWVKLCYGLRKSTFIDVCSYVEQISEDNLLLTLQHFFSFMYYFEGFTNSCSFIFFFIATKYQEEKMTQKKRAVFFQSLLYVWTRDGGCGNCESFSISVLST